MITFVALALLATALLSSADATHHHHHHQQHQRVNLSSIIDRESTSDNIVTLVHPLFEVLSVSSDSPTMKSGTNRERIHILTLSNATSSHLTLSFRIIGSRTIERAPVGSINLHCDHEHHVISSFDVDHFEAFCDKRGQGYACTRGPATVYTLEGLTLPKGAVPAAWANKDCEFTMLRVVFADPHQPIPLLEANVLVNILKEKKETVAGDDAPSDF